MVLFSIPNEALTCTELVMEDSRLLLVVSTGLFSVDTTGELLSDSSDVGVGGSSLWGIIRYSIK